jgi:peptidyl-prolyl cis-trans isomerase C
MIRWNPVYLVFMFAVLCWPASARQDKPATPAQEQPAADTAASDLVVARVAGEPITEKQVLSAINTLAKQKVLPPDKQKERISIFFKDAVDNLVTVAILKGQVKEQNITADPAKVDQQIQQFSKQFPSQADFQKIMASQGVTEADLRKSVEERLTVQQVLDQATKDVPGATDEEISKFYEVNPTKFNAPEQLHASHILLRLDPKSTPEQKDEVKKKIEGIRADIESKAITFAEAAEKYSEDPSNAKKGGDLGFFSRGQMVKPFEEAAFATKPGTLSPVVETQFGYHIIQVAELKPAGKVSLEEAKPAIKQYLDQSAKQRAAQKYMSELRAKASVETFMTLEEFSKRHPSQ